ncbi:DUF6210 family protein [Flavobacterium beibuense]|uniref:DUF6210 family protein n=1 Tax=Flavobacterium beibuense TaxID=657326 RepID=UPI003A9560AB
MKPLIRVYDAIGLGLIIIHPTGIFISNQTGGTACLQPKEEGIYLPVGNEYYDNSLISSPETELTDYFSGNKYSSTGATDGIDEEDVNTITAILAKYRLEHFITIDKTRLKDSHEAWIYVNIDCTTESYLLSGFDTQLKGILTWANSD